MSRFDEEPDSDPHSECREEIHRLQTENAALREEIDSLKAHIAAGARSEPIAVVTETNSGTKLTIFGRLHWFFGVLNSHEAYTLAKEINAEFSQKIVRIPDGWRLVPIDPTPEMIEAGFRLGGTFKDQWLCPASARLSYRTMLAAAPKWEGK